MKYKLSFNQLLILSYALLIAGHILLHYGKKHDLLFLCVISLIVFIFAGAGFTQLVRVQFRQWKKQNNKK